MEIQILQSDDYENYFEHIRKNCKNSRSYDNDLIDKIKVSLNEDDRLIIFVMKEDDKIINSIATKKKTYCFEYEIHNYRTLGNNFFNKKDMLVLFDYVFSYYENICFYKWLTIRPISLFNQKFFNDVKKITPFDRYVTAIEFSPTLNQFNGMIYDSMYSRIPDSQNIDNFMVISGFCLQEYRKQFQSIDNYYLR